jgi:membrane protein DedA with SNARE-associated domain
MAVFCGLAHFGILRFAPVTLLSCVAWVLVLAGGGYVFHGSVERLIGEIKSIEKVLLVIAILIALAFVVKNLRSRKGLDA